MVHSRVPEKVSTPKMRSPSHVWSGVLIRGAFHPFRMMLGDRPEPSFGSAFPCRAGRRRPAQAGRARILETEPQCQANRPTFS